MEMDAEKKNIIGRSDARKRQGGSTVPALPGSCARRESCYGPATGLPASPVAESAIAEKSWHESTPKQKERSPQSQRYRGRGDEIYQKYKSSSESDEEEEEEENESTPLRRLRDPDSFEIEMIDNRLKYDKIIYKKDLASYAYMCVEQLTRFMSETDSSWASNEIDGVVYANLLYDLVQKKEEKLEETEKKLEETEEKLEETEEKLESFKKSYANLKTSYAKLKSKQEKQKVPTPKTLTEEKETKEIAVQTQVLTKEEGIQAQPQQVEEQGIYMDASSFIGLEEKIEEIFSKVIKLEKRFVPTPEDKSPQGQPQPGTSTSATVTAAKSKKKSSPQN